MTTQRETEIPMGQIDWTSDPNNPDEVADAKAAVDRWCSLFERHIFHMSVLTSGGFRPRSMELLAAHPVWIAKVYRGSAYLAPSVPAVMRDLRALFRSHGVHLERASLSVGIRRAEVIVSWVRSGGTPGKVIWNTDGTRQEVLYEIPVPFALDDLPTEN